KRHPCQYLAVCAQDGVSFNQKAPEMRPHNQMMEAVPLQEEESEKILEKAFIGGEMCCEQSGNLSLENWFNRRFLPCLVAIDYKEYAKMCISALRIVQRTAGTDYGTSRQRDLGQLWADMTRGYLGEIALKKFIYNRWSTDIELGHDPGDIQDYLPQDIHRVKKPSEGWRRPRLLVSVKTTKWNGIWLDIPGDQFHHSSVHVLVKIGVGQDHLFAFFKEVSVFRDKILKIGEEIGSLTEEESSELFEALPSFRPVPAYLCGFIRSDIPFEPLCYGGKKGTKHYKITAWRGPYEVGDEDRIKECEGIHGNVSFQGIERFSKQNRYLFNTGNLLWRDEEWEDFYSEL
ncbi:MAG: hypothetical protein R6V10_09735, partial [bacterium]